MSEVGAINAWVCETCGLATVAVHRDEGTTPYMLGCRALPGCTGVGRSMFYRAPEGGWPEPRWEWYRPEGADLAAMSPAMRDHIERGGLEIRLIGETATGHARGASFFRQAVTP